MRATPGGEGVFAVAAEDAPLTWLVTERFDNKECVLVGFGPDGARIDGEDIPAVQAALDRLVPGFTVVEADSHDWLGDEFTQGTWGFLRPGQLTRHLADLQRPHGRVTLAGSELADGWVAFFSGAIESGIRAGRVTMATLDAAA
jgi:monoamine oxidase